MVRDISPDMINGNWANMSFYQLAYDQIPSDLVYKPRLDIFCSALSKILELNETILFPSEKCWTNMLPVPKLEESTCIWKGA